jgi:TPR repeat protein
MEITINDINDWQRLLQAAEAGDAEAQWDVGCYYESGWTINGVEIVQPDAKLGFEWTKRPMKMAV